MEEERPDGHQSHGGQTETDEQKGKNARARFGLSRFRRRFNNSPLVYSCHDILHFEGKALRDHSFLCRNGAISHAFTERKDAAMPEKFDPAPADKHAEDPKQSAQRDKKDDALEKSLKDSFPASDPVSSTQASKATPDT
ncbi:hypothetical protein [Bradyrhizobium sp. CCGUVB14]|uniref:hypothetical protein n=1 Tax=Bradyrhizobium sp. CCGUVB14 TaxID=2949628 RepID=UPI0020B207D7|nr:hypothetical protein [Bradyrhizobium sp. CCGUVB14]MCP3442271.1 hypothetical protein [Bradyrhizobium sp. CCGUVB14]